MHVRVLAHILNLGCDVPAFLKRIVVTDTMPGKRGKGIEVKLEYTIDREYKTYPDQQIEKRHSRRIDYAVS